MIVEQHVAAERLWPEDTVLQPFTSGGALSIAEDLAGRHAYDVASGGTTAQTTAVEPLRNRLLSALEPDEYARIRPHLELVHIPQRQLLFDSNAPIGHVYFPETMVVSLVSRLTEGGTVEVGTAGYEGMAGLPLFLGDVRSSVRAFVEVPGMATRMDAGSFATIAGATGPLHRILLRYTLAFLTQVSQTAACNAAHLVHERCARLLLMTHDRVTGSTLPLSHEYMAFMLGVRIAGVTTAMRALKDAGLIQYTLGWVEVIDPVGLERASCECYRAVRNHTERLLPRRA